MKILSLPPLELLQERFYVSKDSPSGLRYKTDVYHTRARKDAIAGYKQTSGYWTVRVNGQAYQAHRIVYCLLNSEDPGECHVDHTKGLQKPLLVRKANSSDNGCNRKCQSNSKSKIKGIRPAKRAGRWEARISKAGKRIHIGTFDTLEKAVAAYNKKALELHGDFAVLNIL